MELISTFNSGRTAGVSSGCFFITSAERDTSVVRVRTFAWGTKTKIDE